MNITTRKRPGRNGSSLLKLPASDLHKFFDELLDGGGRKLMGEISIRVQGREFSVRRLDEREELFHRRIRSELESSNIPVNKYSTPLEGDQLRMQFK